MHNLQKVCMSFSNIDKLYSVIQGQVFSGKTQPGFFPAFYDCLILSGAGCVSVQNMDYCIPH
jgi:hypothetical protein